MKRIDKRKIGEILISDLGIKPAYVDEILKRQSETKLYFGVLADSIKLIDREKINQALCIQFGLKYMPIRELLNHTNYLLYKDETIYKDIFKKSNSDAFMDFCIEVNIFPIEFKDNKLIVAVADFDSFEIDGLLRTLDSKYDLTVIGTSDYFFSRIETSYKSPTKDEINLFIKSIKNEEDVRVIQLLQFFVTYAIANDISDIHIQPNYNKLFRVSGRMGGVKATIAYIPQELGNQFINIIKMNAKMMTDIKRKPQDGQISGVDHFKDYELDIKRGALEQKPRYNYEDISMRISTYPNAMEYGETGNNSYESIVMRLLNSDESLGVLENLNLSEKTVDKLDFMMKKRTGIIIVSGPTGSGKTTTLYALLSKIDFLTENIITFEDPVEHRHKFWTQGERNVNTENNNMIFNFGEAKKAILRQDPDIILMGEIRDKESAQFAIEAANTGHLVLGTLHANDSVLVIERLKELGVQKEDVINSLICSFSQRLVKKLCRHCKIKIPLNDEIKKYFRNAEIDINEKDMPSEIWSAHPQGCEHCDYIGTKGMVLVDELVHFNNATKLIFATDENIIKQRNSIKETGYIPMIDNAWDKCMEGEIGYEEIVKVVS